MYVVGNDESVVRQDGRGKNGTVAASGAVIS